MVKNRLSTLLGEQRMSQADLSRRTGIRPSTINELYHEYAPQIKFNHLSRICEALGCEISDLLYLAPDEPDESETSGVNVHTD